MTSFSIYNMSVVVARRWSLNTDSVANISHKHVDVIQCANDDSIGLHEKVLRRKDHVVIEIGGCFSEEVLDWLKYSHVNLHLKAVEKVPLNEAISNWLGVHVVLILTMSERMSRF